MRPQKTCPGACSQILPSTTQRWDSNPTLPLVHVSICVLRPACFRQSENPKCDNTALNNRKGLHAEQGLCLVNQEAWNEMCVALPCSACAPL